MEKSVVKVKSPRDYYLMMRHIEFVTEMRNYRIGLANSKLPKDIADIIRGMLYKSVRVQMELCEYYMAWRIIQVQHYAIASANFDDALNINEKMILVTTPTGVRFEVRGKDRIRIIYRDN